MHRRHALSAIGGAGFAPIAGCVDEVTENGTGEETARDRNEIEPDNWEFAGYEPEAPLEGFGTLTVEIRNRSGTDRTYRDTLRYRLAVDHATAEWTEQTVAVDVPAGETGAIRLDRRFGTTGMQYELVGLETSFVVEARPHILEFGEAYRTPTGVSIELSQPELRGPDSVEVLHDDHRASVEEVYALVHARFENESADPKPMLGSFALAADSIDEYPPTGTGAMAFKPDWWTADGRPRLPPGEDTDQDHPPGTVFEGWVMFDTDHIDDVSELEISFQGDIYQDGWPAVTWRLELPADWE